MNGSPKPSFAQTAFFGVGVALSFWLLIFLFHHNIEPSLEISYEISREGGLGNPAVTGSSTGQGSLRFLVFFPLLLSFFLLLSRKSFHPWLASLQDHSLALFVSLYVGWIPFSLLLPPEIVSNYGLLASLSPWQQTGALLAIPVLFLALGAGIRALLPTKISLRRLVFWTASGIIGLGASRLISWIITPIPSTAGRLLVFLSGPGFALVLGYLLVNPDNTRKTLTRSERGFLAVSILSMLSAWISWNPGPALIWIAVLGFAVFKFVKTRMRAGNSREVLIPVLVGLAMITLVGSTARYPELFIDIHHEPESLLPSLSFLQGNIPYKEFIPFHSLAVDCFPTLAGFCIWDVSIHGERLARFFLVGPFRVLLMLLVLTECFTFPWAMGIWAFWWAIQPLFATSNEIGRWELSWMAFFLLFRHQRSGNNPLLFLAYFLASSGVFLAPETGLPTFAAFILLGITNISGKRAERPVWMKALGVALAGFIGFSLTWWTMGMSEGFLAFLQHAQVMSRHLIARCPEQSPLHPMVLMHTLILAIGIIRLTHENASNRSFQGLFPLLVIGFLQTFTLFGDHPIRLKRIMGLDLLLLGLSVRTSGGRFPAHTFLLFLFLVLPFLSHQTVLNLGIHSPVPFEQTTAEFVRIGPEKIPLDQFRDFVRMQQWITKHASYFNSSNSLFDSFLFNVPLPHPYVPMHYGFLPKDQGVLVRQLRQNLPEGILFRSDWDKRFHEITPYTLMFNSLDAFILRHYAFSEKVGVCDALASAATTIPRTYQSLISPGNREPLEYGWAPFFLGKGMAGDTGIDRLCRAAREVPSDQKYFLEISLPGPDRAVLEIKSLTGDGPPVTVFFNLHHSTNRYCIPLWNLCWSPGPDWTREFSFTIHPVNSFKTGIAPEAHLRHWP